MVYHIVDSEIVKAMINKESSVDLVHLQQTALERYNKVPSQKNGIGLKAHLILLIGSREGNQQQILMKAAFGNKDPNFSQTQ